MEDEMDRKLLERLYYDGIMPRERCCPRKKDYHDTMQLCDTVEQEFISLLSKEQKSMFQDLPRWKMRRIIYRAWQWESGSQRKHLRWKIVKQNNRYRKKQPLDKKYFRVLFYCPF